MREALEPWEVINSQGNGPYAIKTILSWTINGPKKKTTQNDSTSVGKPVVMANIISVTRMEDLLQQQKSLTFQNFGMRNEWRCLKGLTGSWKVSPNLSDWWTDTTVLDSH